MRGKYVNNIKARNLEDELKNCSFVKSVLLLLVIIGHSLIYWSNTWVIKNPGSPIIVLSIIAEYLGTFHTYAFALCSGYIYAYIKYEKKGYQDKKSFIINKTMRLLVPYLFLCLVWVVPIAFKFSIVNNSGEMIRNYLLGVNPEQLWFLLMLFLCFMVIDLFAPVFDKHLIYTILFALISYLLASIGSRFIANYYQVWMALYYIPSFLLGVIIRQRPSMNFKVIPCWLLFIIDVVLFMLYKSLTGNSTIFTLLRFIILFCLHNFGAFMSFVYLQRKAEDIKNDNKIVSFFQNR